MDEKKILIFGIAGLLLMGFASAGWFDGWGITGKATSQLTNVSVSITGTNPAQITYVSPISAVNPLEATFVSVNFTTYVYDADGINDINLSSVFANFSKTGETTRTSASNCSPLNSIDSYTKNFSCSINMWYWDGNGAWNVNVRARDLGNGTEVYNTTTTFTYNLLKAMLISPNAIAFGGVASGADNKTATNDPTTINNTGNYNSTIQMTAINLIGETSASEYIPAGNFTIGLTTGAGNPECIGTIMVNGTATTVASSVANRGNLSAGSGAGQEDFYYCIFKVPAVSTQTYSTTAGGAWTIAYP